MAPETRPLLAPESPTPKEARWALQKGTRGENDGAQAPQCVAHRGYTAKQPENTMAAFRAAAAAGAHAIETDLHLTQDGVVVLSHDGSLKRCFGVDRLVRECDWAYIQTLRTMQAPHEPMPSLADLLEFLAEDEQAEMWLILDVKTDDDAEELLGKTAETIASASVTARAWDERISIGCWNKEYLTLANTLLPSHPRCLINMSTLYAAPLIGTPNLAFSLHYLVLAAPLGAGIAASASAAGNPVYAWTINSTFWMEWAVLAGLEAVVTDEVEAYLEVARGSEGLRRRGERGGRVVRAWRAGWLSGVHLLAVLAMAVYSLLGGRRVTRRKGSRPPVEK